MKRLASVDNLRGLTIIAMILVNNPGSWNDVYSPLLHKPWNGLSPTDLIFPFFLFVVGIAISLAYTDKVITQQTYKKILLRSAKLIGLGLLINLFTPYLPFFQDLDTVRIPGVLQRIGVVFCIGALLFLNANSLTLLGTAMGVLLMHYCLLTQVNLPNGLAPTLENTNNNWNNLIDQAVFGSHLWQKNFDPEGILGTLSAIATCLFGILTGKLIHRAKQQKLRILLLAGIGLILLGHLLDPYYPINKNLWTASFTFVTSGWALLVFSLFYYLNDIKNIAFPSILTAVSKNAIGIYVLSMLLSKSFYLIKVNSNENLHSFLFKQLLTVSTDTKLLSLIYALVVVSFYVLVSYYLRRKNLYFKV